MKRFILFLVFFLLSPPAYSSAPVIKEVFPNQLKISSFGLSTEGNKDLDRAIALWNEAAGFKYLKRTKGVPNVVVVPIEAEAEAAGVTWPYLPGLCVVTVGGRFEHHLPTIEHELGHCIGFNDDHDNPRSIMYWTLTVLDGWNETITEDIIVELQNRIPK